jgi:uncharacterized protein (TIGR02147 family)
MKNGDAVRILEREFEKRVRKNSHYSLRGFARLLDLPPGRLSELLSEKRKISAQMASKIAERLDFSPKEKSAFLRCVQENSSASPVRRLREDEFDVIAMPHHYSLLSLMETKGFCSDLTWMAERLQISTAETRAALRRLEHLGLIETKDETYVLSGSSLATSEDIASPALRRSHERSLKDAIASLESVAVEARDVSSITLAVDPAKMDEAKRLIRKFRKDFAKLVETGDRSEVYHLNIQYIPATAIVASKNKGKK